MNLMLWNNIKSNKTKYIFNPNLYEIMQILVNFRVTVIILLK